MPFLSRKKLLALIVAVAGLWGLKVTLFYAYELYLRSVVSKRRHKFKESNKRMFTEFKEQLERKKMSPEEIDRITSLPVIALTEELKQSRITPSAVLTAYQHKALAAHQRTNCLVHPFPEAEELARDMERDEGERGLLYGVPISVKDIIPVKGYTFSAGMGTLLAETAEEDCCIVKVLKKQGAIPFVKTTTPQASLSWHCVNPNTGTTTNPVDPEYGPGGSSSGEGALIGCGGSPIGIGTDVAGSVRCPAVWSGCCALKPTSNRLSHAGTLSNYVSGQQTVWVTTGPMAMEVDGLVTFMKALCVPETYQMDTRAPPLPWRDEVYKDNRPLRFGYYLGHEELFPVTPACRNVVLEVIAALKKRGHEVVPWQPLRPHMGEQGFIRAACGDNGKYMTSYMKGDPPNECIDLYFKYQLGNETSRMTQLRMWLQKIWNAYDGRIRSLFASPGSVLGWWNFTSDIEAWRCEWSDAMKEAGLDAILCPGSAFPAPRNHKDTYKQCIDASGHWSVYNILDIPCGAVPVRTTTKRDVADMEQYNPNIPKWLSDKIKKDMKEGLPLGVQCASYKWQEELCLRAMKEIELAVRDN